MPAWFERDHGLIVTVIDKFPKRKKKTSSDVPGELKLPINVSSLCDTLNLLCYFVAVLHFSYVSFALDFC